MKRIVAGVVCVSALVVMAIAYAGPKMMSVELKEAQIRATPNPLGQVKATLAYADKVEVLETKGSWVKVRSASGVEGWMAASSLNKKDIVLKAGAGDAATGVSDKETTLAGKGFNPEVEKEYQKRNPNLSYRWVDKMETINVTLPEKQAFLDKGQVKPAEGGAK